MLVHGASTNFMLAQQNVQLVHVFREPAWGVRGYNQARPWGNHVRAPNAKTSGLIQAMQKLEIRKSST